MSQGLTRGIDPEEFAKVEQAKKEWESAVDALPELICVIDNKGRIIRTNRTVESWSLGLVFQVQGRDIHTLVHPDCQQPCYLKTFFQTAIDKGVNGESFEQEAYDPILKRHIIVRLLPIGLDKKPDNQGHLTVIMFDNSRRKEMEEAIEQNNDHLKVLNIISSAILAAHSQEEVAKAVLKLIRLVVPYQQARVMLYEPVESKLISLAAMIRPKAASSLDPLPPLSFQTETQKHLERLFLVGDLNIEAGLSPLEEQILSYGSRSYLNIPLQAENLSIGVFVVAMDTVDKFESVQIQTVRQVAELLTVAIRQSQLYQKLRQTNRKFQDMLTKGDKIIENVVHELRSPLALIQGYTRLLTDESLGSLNKEQINALEIIEIKSQQLHSLANHLSASHGSEEEEMQKIPLAFNMLLQEEFQAWQMPAENNDLRLYLELPHNLPIVKVNRSQIKLVISNLLDNAMKYCTPGNKISIKSWIEKDDLMLSVSDQGTGIEKEKLEKIFTKMYRDDIGNAPEPNKITGLPLCKAIVEAHNGRIWAASKGLGHGSTFYVSLPLEKENGKVLKVI